MRRSKPLETGMRFVAIAVAATLLFAGGFVTATLLNGGESGVEPIAVPAPFQKIEASVLAARFDLEPGLVMLNVGSSDAVKRGYAFHIYGDGQYKGQVKAESVQESFSESRDMTATTRRPDKWTGRARA